MCLGRLIRLNKRTTVVLLAAAILLFYCYIFRNWILDDSFIGYRYAENLAVGHGLVFNIGERVEGFTSFLWVVILAGGKVLGVGPLLLSRALGIFFAFSSLTLVAFSYRFINGLTKLESGIATILLASSGIFAAWAMSGMETNMFAWLGLLVVLLALGRASYLRTTVSLVGFGVIGALLFMARPDGLILFAGALGVYVYVGATRKWSGFGRIITGFLAVMSPYIIWKLAYFGYLLPNTFYQKVGTTAAQLARGGKYAAYFYLVSWLLIIILTLTGAVLGRIWRDRTRTFIYPLIGIVVLYTGYIVGVGGDAFAGFRFFVPVIPFLCLITAMVFSRAGGRYLTILLTSAAVAGTLATTFIDPYVYSGLIRESTFAWNGREIGLWLKVHAQPASVLAASLAGSAPYYSGLKTIDILGHTDAYIAHKLVLDMGQGRAGHEKGDGAYVMARSPDLILFADGLSGAKMTERGVRELYEQPNFFQRYALRKIILPGGKDFFIYEKIGSNALRLGL